MCMQLHTRQDVTRDHVLAVNLQRSMQAMCTDALLFSVCAAKRHAFA
jgi:hypothetical protein